MPPTTTPAGGTGQKSRLQWTPALHSLFLEAVAHLGGPERVSPKGILEFMNVEGLTIYHIKSHLQKHRLQLRSAGEPVAIEHPGSGGGGSGGRRRVGVTAAAAALPLPPDHAGPSSSGAGGSGALYASAVGRGAGRGRAGGRGRGSHGALVDGGAAWDEPQDDSSDQSLSPLSHPALQPPVGGLTLLQQQQLQQLLQQHKQQPQQSWLARTAGAAAPATAPATAPAAVQVQHVPAWPASSPGLSGAAQVHAEGVPGRADREAALGHLGNSRAVEVEAAAAGGNEGRVKVEPLEEEGLGRGAGTAHPALAGPPVVGDAGAPGAQDAAPPLQAAMVQAQVHGGGAAAHPHPTQAQAQQGVSNAAAAVSAEANTEPSSSNSALHACGPRAGGGGSRSGGSREGGGSGPERSDLEGPQLQVEKADQHKMQQQLQAGLRACESGSTKSRLQWTDLLHQHFLRAVAQLGGPEEAHPSGILRLMNVEGLTIYHIKSHLQKHRLQIKMNEAAAAAAAAATARGGVGAGAGSSEQDLGALQQAAGQELQRAQQVDKQQQASGASSVAAAAAAGASSAMAMAQAYSGAPFPAALLPCPAPGPTLGLVPLTAAAHAQLLQRLAPLRPGSQLPLFSAPLSSSLPAAPGPAPAAAAAAAALRPADSQLPGLAHTSSTGVAALPLFLPPSGAPSSTLIHAAAAAEAAEAAAAGQLGPSSTAPPAGGPLPDLGALSLPSLLGTSQAHLLGLPLLDLLIAGSDDGPEQGQRQGQTQGHAAPGMEPGTVSDRRAKALREALAFQAELDSKLKEQLEIQRQLKLSLDAHEAFMASLGTGEATDEERGGEQQQEGEPPGAGATEAQGGQQAAAAQAAEASEPRAMGRASFADQDGAGPVPLPMAGPVPVQAIGRAPDDVTQRQQQQQQQQLDDNEGPVLPAKRSKYATSGD